MLSTSTSERGQCKTTLHLPAINSHFFLWEKCPDNMVYRSRTIVFFLENKKNSIVQR